jgi:hypothetical protein
VPSRWDALRPVTPKELGLTNVVRMRMAEASAKIRTGSPVDDPSDVTWPCWAGVVPVSLVAGDPIPEPDSGSDRPPDVSIG